MGWTPSEFWKATVYEFNAGLEGYLERTGGKRKAPAMTRAQLNELMARYPDEPPKTKE